MSWVARTGGLGASGIPERFRLGTVRDEQTLIDAPKFYGVSFALGVSVAVVFKPLDRRPGCGKE
jgi:hypothetical protein